MNVSLSGKKVLVTGASGAIGGAAALALRACGAWVAGSYCRREEEARRLEGEGIRMFQADLADREQARDLVRRVLADSGGTLDGLVYAAGNTRDHTLLKLSDPEWDEVLNLHLTGLFVCCRELMPVLQKQKAGKILAIGSQSGLTGRVGQANYSAAKAGTIGLIKTVAREAGRFGVTANAICPGFVDSAMTRSAPPEAWERARAASALGTVSSAQVVASFITWFLSDHCSGVTGQVFQLDSRIL